MMINQERLFKLLPLFFEKASSAIIEIAQNAQRARATKLEITLQGRLLEAVDNGVSTSNAHSILTLADSDWDPDVEENQTPAGWGLFFLICISEFISFSSKFGTLAVESGKFLNDAKYRNSIFGNIDAKNKTNGFKISATLKPDIDTSKLVEEERLAFFPLTITVNGKQIQRKAVENVIDDYIDTAYQGNRVLIRKYPLYIMTTEHAFHRMLTIWYGIPIRSTYCTNYHNVVIDVTEGSPLTPVLPYRNSIKQDGKLADFLQFVRDEYVKWAIHFINDNIGCRPMQDMINVMKNLSYIATQEEMDTLDFFFVKEEDPCYHNSYSSSQDKIIKKGDIDIVRSENISLTINNQQYEDDDEIVIVPEGIVTKRTTCSKHPSWLRIQQTVIPVAITYDASVGYKGNYKWHKAVIQSSKPISTVALVDYNNDNRIFYTESPRDFYKVQDTVFEKNIYDEDGDTLDSQQYHFEEDIEDDIRHIIGEFGKSHLLSSISEACGIKTADIVAIKITKDAMTVTAKNKQTKKIKIAA